MSVRVATLAVLLILGPVGCGAQTPPGDPARAPEKDRGGTSAATSTRHPSPVRWRVIDATAHSSRTVDTPGAVVVHDGREWARLWRTHTGGLRPPPPLPAVDFSESTVVGYFDGPLPGPVEIDQVELEDRTAVLRVRKSDTSDCPRPQVLENWAIIVELPALVSAARVNREVVPSTCS